jgi:hypothetical protein
MQHPATRAPSAPRVPPKPRHAAIAAAAVRPSAARNRCLDTEHRRASGHRRALVSLWLRELTRK